MKSKTMMKYSKKHLLMGVGMLVLSLIIILIDPPNPIGYIAVGWSLCWVALSFCDVFNWGYNPGWYGWKYIEIKKK